MGLGVALLQGFGSYSYQVGDPQQFVTQLVGAQGVYRTNDIEDRLRTMLLSILQDVQGILIAALDAGEPMSETMQKINSVYEKYIGDPQKIIDKKQVQPYRIETLIRTNGTRAFNTGMMVEYNDPDLEGFVRAVQVSAILDTRTTDICRHADGKIFLLDDPIAGQLTPPLHFNCRTVLIPITAVDGEFEPSKSVDLAGIRQLMPKDFGGTVDRA